MIYKKLQSNQFFFITCYFYNLFFLSLNTILGLQVELKGNKSFSFHQLSLFTFKKSFFSPFADQRKHKNVITLLY